MNNNLLKGQEELDRLRGDQQSKNDELQRCIDSIRELEDAIGQEKSRAQATEQSAMTLNKLNAKLKNDIEDLER